MVTETQKAARSKQVEIARRIPEAVWLRFYIPESHFPKFPRVNNARLSKREFDAEVVRTKRHIREKASILRKNFGLPPLAGMYDYPHLPKVSTKPDVEWRQAQINKVLELPYTQLVLAQKKKVPSPPNVHGHFQSRRQFQQAVSTWRTRIKNL